MGHCLLMLVFILGFGGRDYDIWLDSLLMLVFILGFGGRGYDIWLDSLSLISRTPSIIYFPFAPPHISLILFCPYFPYRVCEIHNRICILPWNPCSAIKYGMEATIFWCGPSWISSEIGGYLKMRTRVLLAWPGWSQISCGFQGPEASEPLPLSLSGNRVT